MRFTLRTGWWCAIPLFCILLLDFAPLVGVAGNVQAIFIVIAAFVFVLLHGSLALGWRNVTAFILMTYVLSFAAEVVGVATGIIFGPYHYTDLFGPRILGVPPLIQFAYVAMGYASMMLARVVLFAPRSPRALPLAAAGIAALFMVGWDVSMDPYQSTVSGAWIWERGGAYFGVPLHNFAGWFCTVLVFMLVYAAFSRRWNERPRIAPAEAPLTFASWPVVLYGLMALGIALTPVVGHFAEPIASPGNYAGTLAALKGSLTLVTVFVMGPPVALALFRGTTKSSENA